jgi:hypothetical protein
MKYYAVAQIEVTDRSWVREFVAGEAATGADRIGDHW